MHTKLFVISSNLYHFHATIWRICIAIFIFLKFPNFMLQMLDFVLLVMAMALLLCSFVVHLYSELPVWRILARILATIHDVTIANKIMNTIRLNSWDLSFLIDY